MHWSHVGMYRSTIALIHAAKRYKAVRVEKLVCATKNAEGAVTGYTAYIPACRAEAMAPTSATYIRRAVLRKLTHSSLRCLEFRLYARDLSVLGRARPGMC